MTEARGKDEVDAVRQATLRLAADIAQPAIEALELKMQPIVADVLGRQKAEARRIASSIMAKSPFADRYAAIASLKGPKISPAAAQVMADAFRFTTSDSLKDWKLYGLGPDVLRRIGPTAADLFVRFDASSAFGVSGATAAIMRDVLANATDAVMDEEHVTDLEADIDEADRDGAIAALWAGLEGVRVDRSLFALFVFLYVLAQAVEVVLESHTVDTVTAVLGGSSLSLALFMARRAGWLYDRLAGEEPQED